MATEGRIQKEQSTSILVTAVLKIAKQRVGILVKTNMHTHTHEQAHSKANGYTKCKSFYSQKFLR